MLFMTAFGGWTYRNHTFRGRISLLVENTSKTVIVSFSLPCSNWYIFFHHFGAITLPVLGHILKDISSPFKTKFESLRMSKRFYSLKNLSCSLNHFLMDFSVTIPCLFVTACSSYCWRPGFLFKNKLYHFLPWHPFINGVFLLSEIIIFSTIFNKSWTIFLFSYSKNTVLTHSSRYFRHTNMKTIL